MVGGALRPVRVFLLSTLLYVPAHALLFTAALIGAGALLGLALPESALSGIGAWSIIALYGAAGAACGAVAGVARAAERAVEALERGAGDAILGLAADEGARLVPSVPLVELRARYEAILDRMVDEMLGRLHLPAPLRRLLRRSLRQAPAEAFLGDCEARGLERVGFTEVRNWTVAAALPRALAPARAQARAWRLLACGVAAALLALAVTVSLLARAVDPAAVVLGFFAAAGATVLVAGLAREHRHPRPWKWRLGILVLAAGTAGWPWLYSRLWPMDLGAAWIVVVAVTVWTLKWGAAQALVEADRPRGRGISRPSPGRAAGR